MMTIDRQSSLDWASSGSLALKQPSYLRPAEVCEPNRPPACPLHRLMHTKATISTLTTMDMDMVKDKVMATVKKATHGQAKPTSKCLGCE